MTTIILSSEYGGGSNLATGQLAEALRGLAQNIAIKAASTVGDLTADNSGGTPGSGVASIPNFTLSAVGSSDCVAKAEFETAAGGVVDAIGEIIAQADAINDVVGAFSSLTDSMGGTAADGTIAAIDVSATGAGSSLASATGANGVYQVLRSRLFQAFSKVNALCHATGTTPLTWAVAGNLYNPTNSATFAAVATTTGTAVDGSDATAANAAILKSEFDARQATIANAVASMAAKLDAMTAAANATEVCTVIAGA